MAISGRLIISLNGYCGPVDHSNVVQRCPSGMSCSKWSWCGNTKEHSGPGCQPEYGVCDAVASETVVGVSAFKTSGVVPVSSPYPIQSTLATITTSASQPAITPSPPASDSVPISFTAPAPNSAPASYAVPLPPAYSPPPASSVSSLPAYSSTPASSRLSPYTMYVGTGEPSAGWPTQDEWLAYDQLFSVNMKILTSSCAQWHVPNNSNEEINHLKEAISSAAHTYSVDKRFILAIVLQESNGCVRAPTTSYSVTNPGLMQSYNGKGTCNCGSANAPQDVQTPCPATEIDQMIDDGTGGTGAGSTSLVQAIQKAACSDVSKYYKAARIYNSGSIAPSGDLQDGVATHCYASDIANRLLGWNGDLPAGCHLV